MEMHIKLLAGANMTSNAVWLVDMGYVVKASDNKFKLDYILARDYLQTRLGKVDTMLFNGYDPFYGISNGLQAFYDAMQYQGVSVCLQPMDSGDPGNNRQRGVDVDLTAHMVWYASKPGVNTIVLTTGDHDFLPGIKLVQQVLFCKVILFSYRSMVHNLLAATVDEWWLFEDEEGKLSRP